MQYLEVIYLEGTITSRFTITQLYAQPSRTEQSMKSSTITGVLLVRLGIYAQT